MKQLFVCFIIFASSIFSNASENTFAPLSELRLDLEALYDNSPENRIPESSFAEDILAKYYRLRTLSMSLPCGDSELAKKYVLEMTELFASVFQEYGGREKYNALCKEVKRIVAEYIACRDPAQQAALNRLRLIAIWKRERHELIRLRVVIAPSIYRAYLRGLLDVYGNAPETLLDVYARSLIEEKTSWGSFSGHYKERFRETPLAPNVDSIAEAEKARKSRTPTSTLTNTAPKEKEQSVLPKPTCGDQKRKLPIAGYSALGILIAGLAGFFLGQKIRSRKRKTK